MVVLIGLLLARVDSRLTAVWLLMVGLVIDILSPSVFGTYLISMYVALILWPGLARKLVAEAGLGRAFFVGGGAFLTQKLVSSLLIYLAWHVNLSAWQPFWSVVYIRSSLLGIIGLTIVYALAVRFITPQPDALRFNI